MYQESNEQVNAKHHAAQPVISAVLAILIALAIAVGPSRADSRAGGPSGVSLGWNTFLGGSGEEHGISMTTDASGNIYVTGSSPTSWGAPVRAFSGDWDVFVTKLSPSGAIIWHTFLGGSGSDSWAHVAVDGGGNVFAVGNSASSWGTPLQPFTGTAKNVFIAKLDPNGNLLWNTFQGSLTSLNGLSGNDIALDSAGNIYVTGDSDTSWGAPIRTFQGGFDAFVAKHSTSGALVWNTFLGGTDADQGFGITVDVNGNIYVAGRSYSTWGSPLRNYQGGMDSYVARLDNAGSLAWHTFLGGSDYDEVNFRPIAVDPTGNIYVAGSSNSTWGAPIRGFTGWIDAYAVKLNPAGEIQWNTFLGGDSSSDLGNAIAVDASGNVYVTGDSTVNWGSPNDPYHGYGDAFAAKLDTQGILQWNTFLGGSDSDYGNAISIDSGGNTFVAGNSNSSWGSPIRPHQGNTDMFVAQVKNTPLVTKTFTSQGSYDGWIAETGEKTNSGGSVNSKATTLRLGDDKSKKQYRSILSFNTSGLPDNAITTSVTLKLKQQSVTGGATFNMFRGLLVDIRKGSLDLPTLQATDFQAPASKTLGPFMPVLTNGWYSVNLTSGKSYINKLSASSGLTQIRLRFKLDDNNNAIANYLSLYSSNAPTASRPQLIIEYYVP